MTRVSKVPALVLVALSLLASMLAATTSRATAATSAWVWQGTYTFHTHTESHSPGRDLVSDLAYSMTITANRDTDGPWEFNPVAEVGVASGSSSDATTDPAGCTRTVSGTYNTVRGPQPSNPPQDGLGISIKLLPALGTTPPAYLVGSSGVSLGGSTTTIASGPIGCPTYSLGNPDDSMWGGLFELGQPQPLPADRKHLTGSLSEPIAGDQYTSGTKSVTYDLTLVQFPDQDTDGVPDTWDNCLTVANPDQADLDADVVGDACDPDIDGDGLANDAETAAGTNPRAADTDGDGQADGTDVCPLDASNSCAPPSAGAGAGAGTGTGTGGGGAGAAGAGNGSGSLGGAGSAGSPTSVGGSGGPTQVPQCADQQDNDGDGLVDGADPGCAGDPFGLSEQDRPACSDGADNDGDHQVDLDDPGCSSAADTSEDNPPLPPTAEPAPGPTAPPGSGSCADGGSGVRHGYFTRDYDAGIGGTAVHLFTFAPQVTYCYDGKTARIQRVSSFGTVDPGVTTAVLEQLGFEMTYNPAKEVHDVHFPGDNADVAGEFDISYDFSRLIDRVGIKSRVETYASKSIAKALAAEIRKHGYSPRLQQLTLEQARKLQAEMAKAATATSGKLRDAGVPSWLADTIGNKVVQSIAEFNKGFDQNVRNLVAANSYTESADQIAGRLVGDLLQRIPTTATFPIWVPYLHITVSPDGTVTATRSFLDEYVNPFLKVNG